MKRTSILVLCAAVLAVCMVANSAQAGIIYAADFNSVSAGHSGNYSTSANYADGNLAGQDSWITTSATTIPINVSNSATNGFVSLTTNGQDDRAPFTAVPNTAGSTVWLSADVTVSFAQAAGDYFLSLGDGGTSSFNSKLFIKSSGTGFVLGTSVNTNTANASYGSTVLDFGTSYHVVNQYDFVSGNNNDTTELYLNPTDPIYGGGTAYATNTSTANDASSIGAVYLRQGASGSASVETVDNIAVAIIPEPASLVLMGLGLIGFVGAVRYRQTCRVKPPSS